MAVNPLDATSAYSQIGGLLGSMGSSSTPATGGGMQSFASTLESVAGDTIKSLHEGEKAAVESANGTGNMASVVTAIDNAELLLTQITAIRDKAITAYQSITSSAI